MVVFEKSELKL